MPTTYNHPANNDGPWYRVYGDELVITNPTRQYATGDVVKGPNLGAGAKITGARVANDILDNNAAPTLTGVWEVTDGTTTVALVTNTAAQLHASSVTDLNNAAAYGYVIPSAGFWAQYRFTAANATPINGVLRAGVRVSGMCYSGEDPARPTG